MMRSMYAGVAGLKTHQTKMDVIGNNIANVNTVAYKSQSVTFSELMYQTTQAASGANAATGRAGINARQIGLGSKTGAINTAISTQGASQTTNNPFDIRITGSNFFIVSNGQDNFFTRDGSFYVDGIGNLAMTSNGYNVMGWQVDPDTQDIKQDTVSALRIMSAENMTYEPEATTLARVTGILDKNDTNVTSTSGKIMNLMFYDKLGYAYTAKFNIKNTDEEGTYSVQLESIVDSLNNVVAGSGSIGTGFEADKLNTIALGDGYIWDSGKLYKGTVADANLVATASNLTATDGSGDKDWEELAKAYGFADVDEFKSLKFVVPDADPAKPATEVTITEFFTDTAKRKSVTGKDDGTGDDEFNINKQAVVSQKMTMSGSVSLTFDPKTGKFSGIGGAGKNSVILDLSTLEPAGRFENIEVDFSTTTMYNNSGTSTIAASNGDENKLGSGRKLGQMSGVTIQNDGRIYASYDNGMSRLLGQIATAEFSNASGLEKQGDNLYKSSQNSGEFNGIGVEVTAGGGYMTTGVLEMSNVDLSAEFTEMITTQRGFQANSRIITVSDTLLEELVNLKR